MQGNPSNDPQVVQVFVSSTFRDLQKERQHLFDTVFPAIRDFCKKRNVLLLERDLRWGITEEESNNGQTLEICLDSINEARPFFIGIIGDRYGWIPKIEEISSESTLLQRYPGIKNHIAESKSITEMEFLYGALEATGEIEAAFFIKNNPVNTEGKEAAEKLSALTQKVLAHDKYEKYPFDDAEDLGRKILSYLESCIEKRFPDENLSSTHIIDSTQQLHVRQDTKVYVSRKEAEVSVFEFIDSPTSIGLITGESGAGKSMLVSYVIENINKSQSPVNVILCKIGLTSHTTNKRDIAKYLNDKIIELSDGKATKILDIGNEDENLSRWLLSSLEQVPRSQKLMIILDGIDALEQRDETHLLKWLPAMPSGQKILFTSRNISEGLYYYSVKGTGHLFNVAHRIDISDLTPEEISSISGKYLLQYGKKLSDELVKIISESSIIKRASALRLLLDELRYFGSHEHLASHLKSILSAETEGELISHILNRISKLIFPNNPEGLPEIISTIHATRYGIKENELASILNISNLQMAVFKSLCGSLLVEQSDLITLADWIRDFLINFYRIDEHQTRNVSQKILEYFSKNFDKDLNRSRIEFPWQLLRLRKYNELQTYASKTGVWEDWFCKDPDRLSECMLYWKPLMQKGFRLSSFNSIPATKENIDAIYKLSLFASDIEDLDSERVFLKKTLKYYNTIEMSEKDRLGYVGNLTHRLANNSRQRCEYELSKVEYESAVETYNQLGVLGICDLASTLIDYGVMLYRIGEYNKAIEKYEISDSLHSQMIELKLPFSMIMPSLGDVYTNLAIAWLRTDSSNAREVAVQYAELANNVAQLLLDHDPCGMSEEAMILIASVLAVYISCKNIEKARELKKITERIYIQHAQVFPHRAGLKYGEFLTNYATGIVYNEADQEEAEDCYMRAIQIFNECYRQTGEVLTPRMAFAAFAYYYLAYIFTKKENYANALESKKSSIIIASKLFGIAPQVPEILSLSVVSLINDFENTKEFPGILRFITTQVGPLMSTLLTKNQHIYTMLVKMADGYLSLENYDLARSIYTKAFELFDDTIDRNNIDEVCKYFMLLSLIACCSCQLNDVEYENMLHEKIISEGSHLVVHIDSEIFLNAIITSGQCLLIQNLVDYERIGSLLNRLMICYSKLYDQGKDFDLIQMLDTCYMLCKHEFQNEPEDSKLKEIGYILNFAISVAIKCESPEILQRICDLQRLWQTHTREN